MTACAKVIVVEGVQVFAPDMDTPFESCAAVLVSASDYSVLARVLITSAEDAALIASAFVMLIVTAGLFRFLRRMLEGVEINPSEEKH